MDARPTTVQRHHFRTAMVDITPSGVVYYVVGVRILLDRPRISDFRREPCRLSCVETSSLAPKYL